VTLLKKHEEIPVMDSDTDRKEDVDQLFWTIDQLNDIEKAIMLLYLEEKSYRIIAEIIGISEKNVSVKIVRIKSKLGKMIKEQKNVRPNE
jgi:RNA polymerase sigma-70 factor, ECF subfamily